VSALPSAVNRLVQRLPVPDAPLRRVRWLFLLFSVLLNLLALPMLVFVSDEYLGLRLLAGGAALGLALRRVREFRRDALLHPAWDSLEIPALVLIVLALGPQNSMGVFFVGTYFRALYGTPTRAIGGSVLYIAAFIAAAVLGNDSGALTSQTLIVEVTGLVFSAMVMHVVSTTLRLHERAMAREKILARTSAALAAAVDRPLLGSAVIEGSLALLMEDGVHAQVSLWTGTLERMVALASAGLVESELPGATFSPAQLPEPYLRAYVDLRSAQHMDSKVASSSLLERSLGFRPRRNACVMPLVIAGELRGVLVASSDATLPRDCFGALENLSAQAAVAFERVTLAEDLHRREGEARFQAMIQHASDVITIVDPDSTVRYQSPSLTRVLGYAPDRLLGTRLSDLLAVEHESAAAHLLAATADEAAGTRTSEWRLRHEDGSWRDLEVSSTNLLDESTVSGIVLNLRDITERKALQEELAFRAFHDALTELPNRTLLVDRLDQAVARRVGGGGMTAVLFIDLDDFKVINDSLGHEYGDLLLITAAQRLRASVRPGDIVARLGGDEFIMLLEDVHGREEAVAVADRVLGELCAPVILDGREVVVSASIGIAVSDSDSASADELLRQGDVAMYAAKAGGKRQFLVFTPAMDNRALARLEMASDLRRALERSEFELHYQPIVELRTGRIAGMEALLRWQHPQRGMIQPSEFIPLAEETGLIIPIGRWVLEEATRQAAAWNQPRTGEAGLVLSVNVSGRQFQHPDLVNEVAGALRCSELDPTRLKLEITESVAMQAGDATIATLEALKALGVQLAIDDFGIGYSSLNYLKRFPVDTLKIDRAFVEGLGHDAHGTAIVRSVINIAASLSLSVTAEGIETAEQFEALRAMACDQGQGYLFSRPVPQDSFAPLLARHTLAPIEPTPQAA
jgi:diguanylate cyclase (GGDEF)-like protein/PAS domain S-box-containing protein